MEATPSGARDVTGELLPSLLFSLGAGILMPGIKADRSIPEQDVRMIPEFTDEGYLPPGIHPATLEEIADRFGREPELRQAQTESLVWLVDLCKRAGVQRLIVNGSFVTDKWEPNDVDCALLGGLDFPQDETAERELRDGLPFIQLAIVDEELFDRYVQFIFGTDRKGNPKGVIEVVL